MERGASFHSFSYTIEYASISLYLCKEKINSGTATYWKFVRKKLSPSSGTFDALSDKVWHQSMFFFVVVVDCLLEFSQHKTSN